MDNPVVYAGAIADIARSALPAALSPWLFALLLWIAVGSAAALLGMAVASVLRRHLPAVTAATSLVPATSRRRAGLMIMAGGVIIAGTPTLLSAMGSGISAQMSAQPLPPLGLIARYPEPDGLGARIASAFQSPAPIAAAPVPVTAAVTPAPVAETKTRAASPDALMATADAVRRSDTRKAAALYREAAALDPDNPEIPFALAGVLEQSGRYDAAMSAYETAHALAGTADQPVWAARALDKIGRLRQQRADFGSARRAHAEALQLNRDLGREDGIATSLFNLSVIDRLTPGADVQCDRAVRQTGYLTAIGLGSTAYPVPQVDGVDATECTTGAAQGRADRVIRQWLGDLVDENGDADADLVAMIDDLASGYELWAQDQPASDQPAPASRMPFQTVFGFAPAPAAQTADPSPIPSATQDMPANQAIAAMLGFGATVLPGTVPAALALDAAPIAMPVSLESPLLPAPVATPAIPDDVSPEDAD